MGVAQGRLCDTKSNNVIVVVGLLGAVGWLVYDRQNNRSDSKDTTAQTSQKEQKQETALMKSIEDSGCVEMGADMIGYRILLCSDTKRVSRWFIQNEA